jgi:ribulose kinase
MEAIMQTHQDLADEMGYQRGVEWATGKLVEWMLANNIATGHGECFLSLLDELTWQVTELRYERERI